MRVCTWNDDLTKEMRRGRVRGAFRSLEARRMTKLIGAAHGGFAASLIRYGDLGPPHRSCQFPLWPDGAAPTHEFCGEPTHLGTSWCAHHLARIAAPVETVLSDEFPQAARAGEKHGRKP